MISERQQTAILGRTFFSRMFETDLMPQGAPQVQVVISVFAFFAAPSLILPLWLLKKYIFPPHPDLMRAMMAADRTMALLLSMTATAIITLAIWENIFPDRRDCRALGVLPVRNRSFVAARLWAIVVLFALLFLVTTVISSFGFGVLGAMTGQGFLRVAVSHFLAVAAGEAFIFFGIVAVQCALLNLTGPSAAHRVAVALQIVLIVTVLQMPLVLPAMRNFVLTADGTPLWAAMTSAALLPPLWFLSLFQALIGHPYTGTHHLVWLAAALGALTPHLALGFLRRVLSRFDATGDRRATRTTAPTAAGRRPARHRGIQDVHHRSLCRSGVRIHDSHARTEPPTSHAHRRLDRGRARPQHFGSAAHDRALRAGGVRSPTQRAPGGTVDLCSSHPDGNALAVCDSGGDQGQLDVPSA